MIVFAIIFGIVLTSINSLLMIEIAAVSTTEIYGGIYKHTQKIIIETLVENSQIQIVTVHSRLNDDFQRFQAVTKH